MQSSNSIASALTEMLTNSFSSLQLLNLPKDTCNCCPPKPECPPACIAGIHRIAAQGERIMIPFTIKNNCQVSKTFRVGVRELKDQDGKPAPYQPELNKTSVTLDAGRSERVVMAIDLSHYENGLSYSTEIVVREKDINQNICFTLKIDNDHQLITASPQDENKFNKRWQNWQSHFYCDIPKKTQPGGAVLTN